ncbi:hypothetical protein AU476_23710 [Cupriavidus sp. UYMSc13B]|nr:hypothetical protein AU476_23710 [Cupriavidus sp. UYMSc13B]
MREHVQEPQRGLRAGLRFDAGSQHRRRQPGIGQRRLQGRQRDRAGIGAGVHPFDMDMQAGDTVRAVIAGGKAPAVVALADAQGVGRGFPHHHQPGDRHGVAVQRGRNVADVVGPAALERLRKLADQRRGNGIRASALGGKLMESVSIEKVSDASGAKAAWISAGRLLSLASTYWASRALAVASGIVFMPDSMVWVERRGGAPGRCGEFDRIWHKACIKS